MPNGTATIEELIAQLEAMLGWPYDQWPQRLVLGSGRTDCSGSQFLAYLAATGVTPGGTVSSALARWCYETNNEIAVEQGKAIRGAWLFWGPDRGLLGFGNNGHIVISLGDGTCLGTPGYGGVLGAVPWEFFGDNQPSGAALIPGVTGYDLTPIGGAPAPLPVPQGQPPIIVDWFTSQQEADMAQLKALLVVHQPSGAVLLTGEDTTGRYCSWVRDPREVKPLVDAGSIQDASTDASQQVGDGFFNTFPLRGDDPRQKAAVPSG